MVLNRLYLNVNALPMPLLILSRTSSPLVLGGCGSCRLGCASTRPPVFAGAPLPLRACRRLQATQRLASWLRLPFPPRRPSSFKSFCTSGTSACVPGEDQLRPVSDGRGAHGTMLMPKQTRPEATERTSMFALNLGSHSKCFCSWGKPSQTRRKQMADQDKHH